MMIIGIYATLGVCSRRVHHIALGDYHGSLAAQYAQQYANAFVCGHARDQALVSCKRTAPDANAVASLPFRELDEPIRILTAPKLLDDPRRDDIGRFSSHDHGSNPERGEQRPPALLDLDEQVAWEQRLGEGDAPCTVAVELENARQENTKALPSALFSSSQPRASCRRCLIYLMHICTSCR
jgi:hypothetical protein